MPTALQPPPDVAAGLKAGYVYYDGEQFVTAPPPPGGSVAVRRNSGAVVGTRAGLNLIEGESVSLTVADDPADQEVDVTVAVLQISGGYF